MSKGSKRRPTLVDEETFEERWERTFKRVWPRSKVVTCRYGKEPHPLNLECVDPEPVNGS